MEIQSAFNAGVQGFQQASQSANKAASDIAKATSTDSLQEEALESNQSVGEETSEQNSSVASASQTQTTPSLTDSIVNLKVSEFQASASANVIKSADEALGTLIDVKV